MQIDNMPIMEVDVTPKHCRELKWVEILKDRDDKPEKINKKIRVLINK